MAISSIKGCLFRELRHERQIAENNLNVIVEFSLKFTSSNGIQLFYELALKN